MFGGADYDKILVNMLFNGNNDSKISNENKMIMDHMFHGIYTLIHKCSFFAWNAFALNDITKKADTLKSGGIDDKVFKEI